MEAYLKVKIDLIDGKKEAAIIFSTDLSKIIRDDRSYIYVDVGGGSTEITIFSNGKIVNSKSFKIGTVRLLNKKTSFKDVWENIEIWLKGNTQYLKKPTLIGSGGNINKIFKLSGKLEGEPLSLIYIKAQYHFLKSHIFLSTFTRSRESVPISARTASIGFSSMNLNTDFGRINVEETISFNIRGL